MNKSDKIYIAGHNGMVGSSLLRLLESKGYKLAWGVGRHVLGSQIFDYWRDPWGRIHEHWTDGDVVNNAHNGGRWDAEVGLNNQWGPAFPEDFVDDPHLHVL